jgi:S-adenosylmethionine:tRNA ribosyltransferase-isomerase
MTNVLQFVQAQSKSIEHRRFDSIIELLNAGDLLVWNNSKVFKARLVGSILHHVPEGVVEPRPTKPVPVLENSWEVKREAEIFLIRPLQPHECAVYGLASLWRVLGKPTRKMSIGDRVRFTGDFWCQLVAKEDTGELVVHFHQGIATVAPPHVHDEPLEAAHVRALCNEHGHIPVPPYVKAEPVKIESYQTVYASDSREGSVAAPTAGFHFTEELIARLRDKGVLFAEVTLHVGLGTFMPMHTDVVDDHKMHSEQVELDAGTIEQIESAKRRGARVVAVGTTTVRTLEGVAALRADGQLQPFSGDVNIFIKPGFEFKVVDALITYVDLSLMLLLS